LLINRLRRVEFFLILFMSISSLAILFILAPLIALFISIDPDIFDKVWFQKNIFSKQAYSALILTFESSITSTMLLLIMGIPLAYVLARYSFRSREFIEGLVDVPLMIPHTVAGIMILLAYGRNGLLGNIIQDLGIIIENNFWGIVVAMMFVSFPLMIDTLKLGYEKISVSLELVARSLGASKWLVFKRITLPLLLPNILVGSLLSWARALSEVGAILIVAYYPKTMNVLIYEWFNNYGLRYALALSIVMVLFSLIVFIVLRVLFRK
jgi:molybdate/tungstate transport system permease protein